MPVLGAKGAMAKQTVIFRIDGMTCSACSSTVERALEGIDGVEEVSVSCVTNLAHVEVDPEVASLELLAQSIDDVGFGATMMEVREKQGAAHAQADPSAQCVELKVEGMTCSACSGTVERHLKSLSGVDRVTVSLILNRAFVVCNAARLSPNDLAEEIESIGFGAEVELVSSLAARCGQASLHIRVTPRPELAVKSGLDHFCVRGQQQPGVLGCQAGDQGVLRFLYNPHAVGARELLRRLGEEFGEEAEVDWVHSRAENEQIQGHTQEMQCLRRDVILAMPPAATVFFFTIGLPSIGCDRDHMGFLSQPLHHGVDFLAMLILCLATPVQFVFGQRFHAAAFRALRRRSPNMDVLVSVSTSTAYFYSAGLIFYCLISPETPGSHDISLATGHMFTMGPVLIAVVLLGKFLEARAKLSAIKAIADLPDSMPSTAVLCNGDSESQVAVELVELGDILRIFAGAKIAVDGVVCSDAFLHVDESLLTGESTAVPKKQGDAIMGGTTCLTGGCLMRVTRVGCDTALGQMCRLVQEAQASKAGVQRTADKVARVFVPTVICLAFVTFLIWAILVFSGHVQVPSGMHAGGHGHPAHLHQDLDLQGSLKLLFAMKFGMAVLMMACPCAMGLATPMAVMVATGVAAKRGCLIKSAAALECAAQLDTIVLDKTGTITEGSPSIQAAACIAGAVQELLDHAACRWERPEAAGQRSTEGVAVEAIGAPGTGDALPREAEALFWWLLGTLESTSDHPIAKCILSMVQRMEGVPPIVAPGNFQYFNGRGVCCLIEQLGGATARVGNLAFYEETMPKEGAVPRQEDSELLAWVVRMQGQGYTVVMLHVDRKPLGAVALRDPVRKDAEWVVDFLSRQLGLEVWLCSGDNTFTTQSIAQEVGICNVVAEALPWTKQDCVQKLQNTSRAGLRTVCFVGDGINDAPALAQADLGLAIGVGAHVAVEAADVALVRSELSDCVTFLALSRATYRTVVLNFFWAFCFNVVSLPMAAGLLYPKIHIPPLLAGIFMATSSCLVVVCSLQLRRFKPPYRRFDTPEMVPLRAGLTSGLGEEPQVIGSIIQGP